ncbi:VOC family protein [Micromonospora craniellae]|uniref:VOC family protein n=1 Tax=Micromonospora craniellae TaxID=2294034 RepID=A0A372G061_9ACTN|nr:VOC family protein [Micromonospora craniellae]QOC94548.1 VOC family protein [Micromonospora craniellae]RFS46338.1 VOC family protein [Micromonospora craniellae]
MLRSEHAAAFDHLIHWVGDLDATMASYDAIGLPTQVALTMPGFRNAAWGVDDERYVELATVDDWDAVATSKYAGSLKLLRSGIDALDGPGLLTFAVDVPDARAIAARLREAGREVDEIEVRFEEHDAGFVEVFVRDAPTYFPFFITYDPLRAEIARMRAAHRAAEGITFEGRPDLIALLIRTHDPDAEARLLADLVGCPAVGSTVALPGAEVRFEEGTPTGLYGIVVRGLDQAAEPTKVAGMTVVSES